MTSYVGRLRAHLGLDTAEFDAGMRGAQVRARTGFGGAFAAAGRMITPLTAGLAAVGAASYAIVAPTLRAAQSIDEAAKAARRVDGSLAGWESLRLSAGEAGVEVGQLADQVQNLNARLAAPDAATQSALARLNLDARALRAMDVDDRVAAIADAVRRLGLDAGQATAVLRGLGVEDRRTAAMMVAGGDSIRAAARDINEYGLAVSDIDASRIEAANDQIGRLSVVSRYLGQQMATELVPRLGDFAQAMTDSMREGGLLRGVIDLMVGGLSGLMRGLQFVGSIGAGFVTWLRDMASGLMAGAQYLGMFRDRAVAVPGALDLVTAAQNTLNTALGTFAITGAPEAGRQAIAYARNLESQAQAAMAAAEAEITLMQAQLARFQQAPVEERGLFTGDGEERAMARNIAESQEQLRGLTQTLENARRTAAALTLELATPPAAVAALTTTLATVPPSARAAAAGLREVSDAASQMQSQISAGADAATSLFSAIRGGEGAARQALARIIAQIAEAQFRAAMISAAGSGGGLLRIVGNLLMPGNARGTPSWRGGLTMVGEDGPEMVNLPQGTRISSAQSTEAMLRGGQVRLVIEEAPGFAARVRTEAKGVAVETVRGAAPQIVRDSVKATYLASREVPIR